MNCWKSINLIKEYGAKWIIINSSLISLLSFIILFIPLSIIHQEYTLIDSGIIYLIIAILLLPTLHSFMHILPLFHLKRRMNMMFTRKKVVFPILFTFKSDAYIDRKTYILSALAPTFFITIPSLIVALLFPSIFVYVLIISSINIGMSFLDMLTIGYLIKAPKNAYIENSEDGFDILIKAN